MTSPVRPTRTTGPPGAGRSAAREHAAAHRPTSPSSSTKTRRMAAVMTGPPRSVRRPPPVLGAQGFGYPPRHARAIAGAETVVDVAHRPRRVDDVGGRQLAHAQALVERVVRVEQDRGAKPHLGRETCDPVARVGAGILADGHEGHAVAEAGAQSLENGKLIAARLAPGGE